MNAHGAMPMAPSVSTIIPRTAVIKGGDSYNFATATNWDVQEDSTASLGLASLELDIAQRILAVLRDDLDMFAVGYLSRLEKIANFADANRAQIGRIAGTLASQLSSARNLILEDAPTAKRWVRLAAAINPDTQPKVPARFIRKRVKPELDVDWYAVEAAASIQSFVS